MHTYSTKGCTSLSICTGWQRGTGCLHFRALFLQKSPMIIGSLQKETGILRVNSSMSVCSGWRRCIGCCISQVSFRKRVKHNRALFRKETYEDKASYASSLPCNLQPSRCDNVYRSLSAKKPLIIWLFGGKRPVKIKHSMCFRHSVTCNVTF